MPSIIKILRVAADPNRLRILLLLKGEELSVAELQEILAMGQSTISTHLAQLKQAELVEDRRAGKNSLYRLNTDDSDPVLIALLAKARHEIPEAEHDQLAMRRTVRKRQDVRVPEQRDVEVAGIIELFAAQFSQCDHGKGIRHFAHFAGQFFADGAPGDVEDGVGQVGKIFGGF